ncbi:sensor histidine kinase [Nocardioides sp. Soil805]|uniref:sensor histidine kinase n=1 Tax=Nocardioides sp. Soil805 TaxID=1736416 RepID=UPI0007031C10|nr:DUF4118 domain-containing protein [Nocardioides sp. Soil805]KRF30577.1 histidine kinase [Nocardioides sp. Soil805]
MDERGPRRGKLIVYLGAAPGVGKTFAMLDEAHRRLGRGTDVVVGLVETHDRPQTAAKLAGLEVVPRRTVTYRGSTLTEMDAEAVIARHPAVVLVDELAHTNVPGSRHAKRWQDVEDIRRAGIDVITTVNIQHLASLNDEVERITGVRQRETVPDAVVRAADQVQLVDMSPEALRRRLAHGNVYRAEAIDASLTSYFRVGNLTALRELALLWLADKVDDALDDYRREHRIDTPWPARERVVVAITGGAEGETVVRRAARIASRSAGSELIAVHVVRSDGLSGPDGTSLRASRELVEELGGSLHSVVGDDVPEAVIDFARGVNASMVVVGVSSHTSLRQLFVGSTATEIARLSGPIDVHLVTHDKAGGPRRMRRSVSPLSRSRQAAGWVAATVLPVLVTLLLSATHTEQSLPLEVMSYLAVTVLVAMVGGLLPGLAAALAGFLLLNWFFTEPVGQWTVSEPRNLVALLVFVVIAAAVSSVVDRASRVAADAARARAEATTMSGLSQSVLTGDDTAQAVVARLRATFGLESVSLLARHDDLDGWELLAADGPAAPETPEAADAQVRVDDRRVLALRGRSLRASEMRVLDGFAVQAGLVLEYRRLRERDARAAALEHAEATSTALLRAVSHDLRTPLATIRASVDGLVGGGRLGEAERAELLSSLDGSTDQLERLIDNLLDLSRLSSGLLTPRVRDISLDEVLPLAVAGHPPGAVVLDLDEEEPLVRTDPGLLERVVANVVANAVRHAPGTAVRVDVHAGARDMEIRVADRGPGVSEAARERMFEPFQRLGDATPGGLGLGLAVARGLADAVGATLVAEDTPGGGLTMVLTVPLAVAGS